MTDSTCDKRTDLIGWFIAFLFVAVIVFSFWITADENTRESGELNERAASFRAGYYTGISHYALQVWGECDKDQATCERRLQGLSELGSSSATMLYRQSLIAKALVAAGRDPKNASTSVEGVDTTEADQVLLDAMDFLADGALYRFLNNYAPFFDPIQQNQKLGAITATLAAPGSVELNTIHSTLSDRQKIALLNCYRKLQASVAEQVERRGEYSITSYGACSSSFRGAVALTDPSSLKK
ncbi:hypothetical protein ACYPKM_00710 [Pseudomonas aeruginosa]